MQLNDPQNKVNYFRQSGKNTDAENVAGAALEAKKKTIADFTDNFKFCPVYFFMDSNMEKIRNKQFDGALLKADGSLAEATVISSSDTDYLVVRFGIPDDGTTIRTGNALVICSWKFEQLFTLPKHTPPDKNTKYSYYSQKYNIEYYPFAKKFESTIGRAFSNPQAR